MTRPATGLPLAVSGLTKQYGQHEVLRGLNLNVVDQAIHGLVGLNGSGKTTTLECVLGMQGFDAGNIRVLGFTPRELYKSRGRIVGIFDTPSLHPNLTVRQNLEHARLLCVAPVRASAEVEKLLDIERYRDFRIRHLSLGNRRRASIAQALLGSPEMIVLDEPFNGLDAEGVEHVLNLVKNLNREDGTAFLLSSHQLPYLEQICTHIAILHRGTIPVSGAAEDLFRQQEVTLSIRCDQPALAVQMLATAGLGKFIEKSSQLIEGILTGKDSAAVNHLLVRADIAVYELVPSRASLASLFQSVTSEAKSTADVAEVPEPEELEPKELEKEH